MSSGRSFQAVAGIFKAAGRSGGYSAFNNVARSCFRVAGSLNGISWKAAAANLPQLACHSRAQPTYGFAAQGVQTVTESCDAATSDGSSEGGSTLACCGNDAGCLSEGDSEGVIPHGSAAQPAPPWNLIQPLPEYKLRRRDDKYHRSQRSALCPTSLLRAAWQPPCLVPLPTSCTGVRQPLAMMTAVPYDIRLYAKHAVADGSAAYGDLDYTEATHLQHPSRPLHAAPLPHPASDKSISTAEYRKQHGIYVEDPERPGNFEGIPEPFQKFSDAPFPPSVMNVMRSARFSGPSAIQAQAWPIALEGRDLVAIASTGSGKTLGFLLPAIMHIKNRGSDPALGPTAVVLVPTRELARQTEVEASRFSQVIMSGESSQQQQKGEEGRIGRQGRHGHIEGGLRTVCVYGGADRGGQLRDLRRQPHLIIATPGRLMDFIQSGDIRMKQVSFLVLDEADRMLDMGFEHQIAEVSRSMSSDRQTLFFSATWPSDVRDAAAAFAKRRAVRLFIGDVQSKPVAASTITQRVKLLDGVDKLDALEAYLREQFQRDEGGNGRRAIVFCQTKAGCDHLTHNINSLMSFQAASLHGDKSQASRDYALAKFRAGKVPVLVATDVAARGLDIPHVTCVVNFDMPNDIEMYIHRIGRTGRAGAKGQSLALVNPSRDGGVARSLLEVLEDSGQEVPQELVKLAQRSGGRGGYSGQRQSGRGSGPRRGGGGFGSRGHRREEGGFVGSGHPQADGWRSGSGGRGRASGYSRQ